MVCSKLCSLPLWGADVDAAVNTVLARIFNSSGAIKSSYIVARRGVMRGRKCGAACVMKRKKNGSNNNRPSVA